MPRSDAYNLSSRPCPPCLRINLIVLFLAYATTAISHGEIVINEVLASNRKTNFDDDLDTPDWVEILNTGEDFVNLRGYLLSDDISAPGKWVFPHLDLAPGQHFLVWCSGKDRTTTPREKQIIEAQATASFSPQLVSLAADWRYLTGSPNETGPAADWMQKEFDDANWSPGKAPLGFGEDDLQTVLPTRIGAVFLRCLFQSPDPKLLAHLSFRARYDDGFVLYLNGTRILSVNFPEDEQPTFASTSSALHSALLTERFDLSRWQDLLVTGENQLALVLLNRSPTSQRLLITPELGTTPRFFHTNFEISTGGETITLSTPSGWIADRVSLRPQLPDVSWARSPNATGTFLYHLEPTPGEENRGSATDVPAVVEKPELSVDHGFFGAPFEVEITTTTPQSEIRYTLDGSVPSATNGILYDGRAIPVTTVTILRAIALREGWKTSESVTCTYLFQNDILEQEVMARRVVDDPLLGPEIAAALTRIPSVSVVGPKVIDNTTEVVASLEFMEPDGGGFQQNVGVKKVGAASLNFPKNNFRLYFRGIYGPPTLDYPLFQGQRYAAGAARSFDRLSLRGGAHDSVNFLGAGQHLPANAQYLRNRWVNDMQLEMDQLSIRGLFVHLYINGTYWGHYHLMEHPTRPHFAAYLGGDREDYEAVIASRTLGRESPAWEHLAAIRQVAEYDELRRYIDVENFVDYMLLNHYAGNANDWSENQNWAGGGPSLPDRGGYKFIGWDSDLIFRDVKDNNLDRPGPGRLFTALLRHDEFRMLLADRIHKHFANDGLLTPVRVAEVYNRRAEEIYPTVLCESARWTDGRGWTRDEDWQREWRRLRTDFFTQRTPIVSNQMRSAGWFARLEAPKLSQHGGPIEPAFDLAITAPQGLVYFTTDGSDPRLPGGGVHPDARALEPADETITLDVTTTVRARAFLRGRWSALAEATFAVAPPLRITEVLYHPAISPDDAPRSASDFEFLEFKNVGDAAIDVTGMRLAGAVQFVFPGAGPRVLAPGEIVLVVSNMEAFSARYDATEMIIAGQFLGRLSDIGDAIRLRGLGGETLFEFRYSDAWHPQTDGDGHSLVLVDSSVPLTEISEALHWQASTDVGGSPGEDGPIRVKRGLQIPGDLTQDSRVNLTDATELLVHLFRGPSRPLPCEGASLGEGGNLLIADVNGDTQVDMTDAIGIVTYLFARGAVPSLGTDCTHIASCPDACEP